MGGVDRAHQSVVRAPPSTVDVGASAPPAARPLARRRRGPGPLLLETPDGAWAEFIRHEEIVNPAEIETIARSLWAIDLQAPPSAEPDLAPETLIGGVETYEACRLAARSVRDRGLDGLVAPSAALLPDTPSGFRTEGGLRPGPAREERTIVLFGLRTDLVGWVACASGRPRPDLVTRVRQLSD